MTQNRTGLADTEPVGSDRRSFLQHMAVVAPLASLLPGRGLIDSGGAGGAHAHVDEASRSKVDSYTLFLQDENGNGPPFTDDTTLYERGML